MEDNDIPASDTYESLGLFRYFFFILGWIGIIGGAFVTTIGFRMNRVELSGPEIGLPAVLSGIIMLGIACLMSAVESIGESTRATQIAFRDHLARLKSDRPT